MIKEILENKTNEKVDAIYGLKDSYYGVADHLDNIVEHLKYVSKDDAERIGIDVPSETKIFKQIQKLFKSSDIGAKLW